MVSKKLLMNAIAGIAGLAALGLSTFASAGGEFAPAPAPVAGCDEGAPNFYIGGRVGYGNNYWNNADYNNSVTAFDLLSPFRVHSISRWQHTKHTGFAGGVEIGYAFNKFLAIEAGYMYLPRAKFHEQLIVDGVPAVGVPDGTLLNAGIIGGIPGILAVPGVVGFPLAVTSTEVYFQDALPRRQRNIDNYAFDISGKISILFPGVDNVGLFAKAGVGFLQSRLSRHNNAWGGYAGNWGWGGNRHHKNRSNTNLTYGFGIFWNFTPNMTLDGRFQRWNGRPGKSGNWSWSWGSGDQRHKYQPHMDAYTIGLTYHIDGSGNLFNT